MTLYIKNAVTMKKILKYISVVALSIGSLTACNNWFDVEIRSIETEEEVFSSKDGILSVLANIYGRLPDDQGFNADVMNDWDESITDAYETREMLGSSHRRYWDYDLVREINLFLENLDKYSTAFLQAEDLDFFRAEGRFLRAYVYMQFAKNMGGVPLITRSYTYEEGNGSAEYYQMPRNTEEETYRFVIAECDSIKNFLDVRSGTNIVKNRASYGAALALESRAALYAASIARYTPKRRDLVLRTDGWEAGIPEETAEDFYKIALRASEELIESEIYDLYDNNSDKVENFYEALIKKNENNREVIFVRDYDGTNILNHFTATAIPRSMRASGGSHVNPTLNLAEQFETIDGKVEAFKTVDGNETVEDPSTTTSVLKYIVYDKPSDLFGNRDPRMEGTILVPGSSFRNQQLQLWAGLAVKKSPTSWEFKHISEMEDLTSENKDDYIFDGRQITGADGPHISFRSPNPEQVTSSGFLLRKYVDAKAGSEMMGQSDLAFCRFRFAEVLLNAAEAAWELSREDLALKYLNRVRKRAGIRELKAGEIKDYTTFLRERTSELAFEGIRFYDLKRFRISDKLFTGNDDTKTSLIYGLWAYKVYAPGDPDDGKWIFRRIHDTKRKYPLFFQTKNYYASIDQGVLNNNPLLVKNPYQE